MPQSPRSCESATSGCIAAQFVFGCGLAIGLASCMGASPAFRLVDSFQVLRRTLPFQFLCMHFSRPLATPTPVLLRRHPRKY
jgi:hypothetical protein